MYADRAQLIAVLAAHFTNVNLAGADQEPQFDGHSTEEKYLRIRTLIELNATQTPGQKAGPK